MSQKLTLNYSSSSTFWSLDSGFKYHIFITVMLKRF